MTQAITPRPASFELIFMTTPPDAEIQVYVSCT